MDYSLVPLDQNSNCATGEVLILVVMDYSLVPFYF